MPFRHVAFFIKCRARGCGICSCSGAGGRNCSVRFCLLHPPKLACATIEVDKNGVKCLDFVYRILQKGPARPPKPRRLRQLSYWELLKKSACTRPVFTAPYPNAAKHHRCIQKHWILQKKEPPKIGRFLRCAAFIFFSVIRS